MQSTLFERLIGCRLVLAVAEVRQVITWKEGDDDLVVVSHEGEFVDRMEVFGAPVLADEVWSQMEDAKREIEAGA